MDFSIPSEGTELLEDDTESRLVKMFGAGAFKLERPQNIAAIVADIRRWGEFGMIPALNARRYPNRTAIIVAAGLFLSPKTVRKLPPTLDRAEAQRMLARATASALSPPILSARLSPPPAGCGSSGA